MEQKKPWYKSKIAALGIVMGVVGLSTLTYNWLGGQGIGADQIQVIETTLPNLSGQIKGAIETKNYLAILSAVGGFITAIWRIWFTEKAIG